MNRAQRSIEEALRRQVESHGLSLSEFAVLEALLHKGPLAIGEIGSRVLRSSGSMTYVVDKLERRGLIRRRDSSEDRRIILADLTSEGRTLIESVFPEHASLLSELLGSLTVDELESAADLVKRAGLHADEHGRGALQSIPGVRT